MKYVYIDPDLNTGIVMDEEDLSRAAGAMGTGIVLIVIYYLALVLIGSVIIAPFFALAFLDNFVETVIAKNAIVFLGVGVIIVMLKLSRRFSGVGIVRFLFSAYIIVSCLYLLLYVLNFDTPVYAIFKIVGEYLPENADRTLIDLWGMENLASVDGHWVYKGLNFMAQKVSGLAHWMGTSIAGVDNSSLQAAASDINITEVLKAVGLYIYYGGVGAIGILLAGIVFICIALIVVVLPYVITLCILIVLNRLIYAYRTKHIRAVKKDEKYTKNIKICIDELKAVIDYPSKKAVEVYEKAAKQGNPLAQLLYAQALSEGKYVLQDEKEAFHWYRKSALQGKTEAQYMLAIAYLEGIGTIKDKMLARAWLVKVLHDKNFEEMYKNNPEVKEGTITLLKKTKRANCI